MPAVLSSSSLDPISTGSSTRMATPNLENKTQISAIYNDRNKKKRLVQRFNGFADNLKNPQRKSPIIWSSKVRSLGDWAIGNNIRISNSKIDR